jgi:hypothetical protein
MANSLVKLTLESNQYEKNIREAQKSWNQFVNGIGLSVGKITAVGAAIGAVTGALKVARDAFFKSEEHLDDWNRAIGMAESTYNGFLNALNTGDVSGFLQNIRTITEAARAAYDAMDELGTFNAFNQVNTQRARTGMTEAMAGYKMGETSKDQVKAAAVEYKKQLQERQRLETEAYRQQIRKLAAERGVSWGGLEQALTGKYGDYKKLKSVMPTGERMVTTGGGMFTSNSYIEKYAITPQEKMGEALRALNDTELQNLQALGAQAQRTGEEIAQVDKQLSRIMNGKGGGGVAELQKKIKVGGGGGKKNKPELPLDQRIQNDWTKASEDFSRLKVVKPEGEAGPSDAWKAYTASMSQAFEEPISPLQQLNAELQELQDNLEKAPDTTTYQLGLQAIADKEKEIAKFKGENPMSNISKGAKDTQKSFIAAASSINAVGNALNGIEDPTSKILGLVAQAIASVAAGAGQAISASDTTASGWAWIGAAAAIAAEMVAIISTIHSATGYAEGGVIPGNSYSGDNQWARVNAGETILTRAQAGVLASQLQGVGLQNLNLSASVSGEQIRLVLNNNGRRTGRGEYVTTHFAQ